MTKEFILVDKKIPLSKKLDYFIRGILGLIIFLLLFAFIIWIGNVLQNNVLQNVEWYSLTEKIIDDVCSVFYVVVIGILILEIILKTGEIISR